MQSSSIYPQLDCFFRNIYQTAPRQVLFMSLPQVLVSIVSPELPLAYLILITPPFIEFICFLYFINQMSRPTFHHYNSAASPVLLISIYCAFNQSLLIVTGAYIVDIKAFAV
ncbi:hypothetical protein P691DRAFT_170841 [Macrolepiota fuliginosa MF-IS2]|uniref:Uncharacterized protein n=1 Tax=Macrolepiota fuliginosa MF-IS2 TaxID=1400762 RepID=A0A9P5X8M2_9AGAR|nr:hypothetical protein P691DRAFT_170841 [Macrolepiota fuliginosa MF-IS2]